MNWKTTLEGAIVATIGGAVSGGAMIVTVPGWTFKGVGVAAFAGSLIGLAGWFKSSPIK